MFVEWQILSFTKEQTSLTETLEYAIEDVTIMEIRNRVQKLKLEFYLKVLES